MGRGCMRTWIRNELEPDAVGGGAKLHPAVVPHHFATRVRLEISQPVSGSAHQIHLSDSTWQRSTRNAYIERLGTRLPFQILASSAGKFLGVLLVAEFGSDLCGARRSLRAWPNSGIMRMLFRRILLTRFWRDGSVKSGRCQT